MRIPAEARRFYDEVYEPRKVPEGAAIEGRERRERDAVEDFIAKYARDGFLLDIGCGYAPYQNLCDAYIGSDISARCAAYLRKPYVAASGTALPFADASFRAVLSLHTLEHVHDPERMLEEIHRILASGGAAFLLPSWYVRPWAPQGLKARAIKDLTPRWKLVKALLPLLEAAPLRAALIMPSRLWRLFLYLLRPGPVPLRYRHVAANYERFLDSDSDACASIDPFDVILFFHSRGGVFPDLQGWISRLLFRTGALVVSKRPHRTVAENQYHRRISQWA